MIRRCFISFFAIVFLFALSVLPATAEEKSGTEEIPKEFFDFLSLFPDSVTDRLPDGIFSKDPTEFSDGVQKMSSFSHLLESGLALIGAEVRGLVEILAPVCGILLLSAVLRTVRTSFGGTSIAKAFSLISSLVIFLSIAAQGYEGIRETAAYFKSLNALTGGIIPLTGFLYTLGGNASAAVAASGGLSVYMAVLETLVGKSILPFCGICLSLSALSSINPEIRMGTLLSTVKKNYTTFLGFLMMLLISMLGAQTVIGARADTLAMRSVKFAAGNMIPVVGGSVSELLRSVSAGVSYLRGTVGICGILLLLFLLLPTVIKLFLMRLCWQLAASLADILGCDSEKRLLEEFASLGGYLIAAICICSSVFVLSLTVLANCSAAI